MQSDKTFWMWLWKNQGLLPKHQNTSGYCHLSLCNSCNETVMHPLFGCHFARTAWWASPLSIRSDTFQGNFKETMQAIISSLSDADINRFVCMAWAVWRSRNDAVMGGKQQNTQTCNRYFREAKLACSNLTPSNQDSTGTLTENMATHEEEEEYACYVDGSWDDNGMAGVGVILTRQRQGSPVRWISKSVKAMGAAQAEAMGVLETYKLMLQGSCKKGCVFSDSLETVDSLSDKQPLIHDSRSFDQIWAA